MEATGGTLVEEYSQPSLADQLPMKVLFGKRPKIIGYVSVFIYSFV